MYVVVVKSLQRQVKLFTLKEKEEDMGLSFEALKDIVQKEIARKMVLAECFTAYDVTTAIRGFIKSDVAHAEVRDYIHELCDSRHELFANQDYMKTECHLANGTPVYVFHYVDDDAQAYINSIDNGPTNVTPVVPNGGDNCKCKAELAAARNLYDAARDVLDVSSPLDLSEALDGLREAMDEYDNIEED